MMMKMNVESGGTSNYDAEAMIRLVPSSTEQQSKQQRNHHVQNQKPAVQYKRIIGGSKRKHPQCLHWMYSIFVNGAINLALVLSIISLAVLVLASMLHMLGFTTEWQNVVGKVKSDTISWFNPDSIVFTKPPPSSEFSSPSSSSAAAASFDKKKNAAAHNDGSIPASSPAPVVASKNTPPLLPAVNSNNKENRNNDDKKKTANDVPEENKNNKPKSSSSEAENEEKENNDVVVPKKENKNKVKGSSPSSSYKPETTENDHVVSPRPAEEKKRNNAPLVPPILPEDFPVFNDNCIRDQTTDDGTTTSSGDHPVFEWQTRAPYPVLLGTQKGGTKALHAYLAQHPLAADNEDGVREIHFFDNTKFIRNESGIPVAENQKEYGKKFVHNSESILANPDRFAVDSSPRYLMYSDRVPAGLLCVAPWTKWIVLLRNPVERVISHYNMMWNKAHRAVESYEQFITDDLHFMNASGLLQNWNEVDFETFSGSEREAIAWTAYQQNWVRNTQVLPVGRSLYAIQMEQYYAAMDKFHKPRSHLLVLRSEDLATNTQAVYDQVLDFLGLPPHTLQNTSAVHTTAVAPQTIPDEWRRYLEDLYEPYNQRLYRLLGWDESMHWKKTTT